MSEPFVDIIKMLEDWEKESEMKRKVLNKMADKLLKEGWISQEDYDKSFGEEVGRSW